METKTRTKTENDTRKNILRNKIETEDMQHTITENRLTINEQIATDNEQQANEQRTTNNEQRTTNQATRDH